MIIEGYVHGNVQCTGKRRTKVRCSNERRYSLRQPISLQGKNVKLLYLKNHPKLRSRNNLNSTSRAKVLRFPVGYRLPYHARGCVNIGLSRPPEGWSGTWTHQDPYLTEKSQIKFPYQIADVININQFQALKGFLILLAQEKSITPKTKYLAIRLLAVGLLIIMCASNLIAETAVPQKKMTPDLSKTTLGIDRMNLIKESKEYNFKDHLPNIIRGSDNIEHSKGNSSIILAYIILGLLLCLFAFYVIYIILDLWVLSRREWTQRYGEPEHEWQLDSLPSSSLQTNTESTSHPEIPS